MNTWFLDLLCFSDWELSCMLLVPIGTYWNARIDHTHLHNWDKVRNVSRTILDTHTV